MKNRISRHEEALMLKGGGRGSLSMSRFAVLTFLSAIVLSSPLHAVDGTWTLWNDGTAAGSTVTPENWLNDVIGEGVDSTVTLLIPNASAPAPTYKINVDTNVNYVLGHLVLGPGDWGNGAIQANFTGGGGFLTFDTTSGTPTITMPASAVLNFGTNDNPFNVIQGNKGLQINGGSVNFVSFVSANPVTLTGGIELVDSTLGIAAVNHLNGNTVTLTGESRLQLGIASEAYTLSNDYVLNNSGSAGFLYAYPNSSRTDISITGTISETGGSRDLSFGTATNSGLGVRYILSGDNSYSGDTIVEDATGAAGPIIVQVTHDNGLGVGESEVIFARNNGLDALELSGGITVSDKTITLNGAGDASNGSLASVDGSNTWAGDVALGVVTTPSIGVLSGSLTVTGEITGDNVSGLRKVGAGNLILTGMSTYVGPTTIAEGSLTIGDGGTTGSIVSDISGADGSSLVFARSDNILFSNVISGGVSLIQSGPGILSLNQANTFTGNTVISQGGIAVGHASALGGGGLSITDGVLIVNSGVLLEVASLSLTDDSRISLALNSQFNGTGVTASDQFGTGTYVVDILNGGGLAVGTYTLLSFTGSVEATGFVLGETLPDFDGSLSWEGGVLTLNITQVPEPSVVASLLVGTVFLGVVVLRRRRAASTREAVVIG